MTNGEPGGGLTEEIDLTAGKWYADWTSGDKTCKNDDKAPQYMKNSPDYWLFDTQVDCCEGYFSHTLSDCLGTSGVTSSNKYYPDWSGSGDGCIQDTVDTPAPKYMHGSNVWLFDTLDACCDAHFSYDNASCKGQPTAKWYVDWSVEKCYKNCDVSGTDCGGFVGSGPDLFDSQTKCCASKVSYNFRECMDI